MRKLNVLFVTAWWPNTSNPSNGIFIQEHAEAISQYHNLTVFHIEEIIKSNRIIDLFGVYNIESINKDSYNLNRVNGRILLRRFGALQKFVNRIIKNFIESSNYSIDLVHINVLPNTYCRLIFDFFKDEGYPIVLTEHSTFYHTEIYQGDKVNETIVIYSKLLNSKKLRRILTVSNNLMKVLINDYLVDKSKLEVVPNVANKLFRYNNRLDSDNPGLFVELLRNLKVDKPNIYNNLKVNWIGTGPKLDLIVPKFKEDFSDLDVRFFGNFSKDKISEILNDTHFLVHPTSAENLPCIIIESLCCGCPVISADINGVSELINDSNGLLYEVDNLDSFYEKFIEMIYKQNILDRIKISEEAQKKYSSKNIGKLISDIYCQVIDESRKNSNN
jgi:glycosyltransferase involved in cell wall biosynthesis